MKTNKKNKIIESALVIGVLVLVLCCFVDALGISSVISESQNLEASAGQEVFVDVKLVNQDIENGATFKGEIVKGSEIISVDKASYYVPYQDVVVAQLKVKIPADATIGQTYNIAYKFSQIPNADDKQGITFSQSFQSGFMVKVVPEKPVELTPAPTPAPVSEGISTTTIIILIIAIIVVIAIILFLIKKKK